MKADQAAVQGKGNGRGKRERKGRIGRDQQEAVLNAGPVKEKIGQLENLYRAAATADDDLNDAIKKTAEESGFNSSTIKALVAARVKDNVVKKQREVTQLALLFEEVV